MEEFQAFTPEDIIQSNLDELSLRFISLVEQERAHLRELASEIASTFSDGATFFAALPEHRFPNMESGNVPKEYIPMMRTLDATRRARLCSELCHLLPSPETLWMEFFFPSTEEPNSFAHHRISYQKNRYTEEAYHIFAKLLREPRAAYVNSFPAVCEDVYNGLSEFCILPLENTAEGRLSGFTRLIVQFDMKIVAACDVPTGEGKSTRFALLRKNRISFDLPKAHSMYFEAVFEEFDFPSAEELLFTASSFGLSLCKSDITTSADSHKKSTLHAVFGTDHGDLSSFLLYLAMELPDFTPLGYYPNLSIPS